MSKAEEFIKKNTKDYSNEYLTDSKSDGLGGYISRRNFSPWLTPDQARKAVEIAREEMVEKVIWWIEENIGEYCDGENIMFSAIDMENIDIFEQERFINDLKQAMKDE